MYTVFNVQNSLLVQYKQEHYFTAISVCSLCAESSLYCSLCQCGVYRVIIVLQSVSLRYFQSHYFTAVCECALYWWSLWYCSLCQCVMYRGIIVVHSVSIYRVIILMQYYLSAVCTVALLYCSV